MVCKSCNQFMNLETYEYGKPYYDNYISTCGRCRGVIFVKRTESQIKEFLEDERRDTLKAIKIKVFN